MVNMKQILKVVTKFAGPVLAGVMTVASEIESDNLKKTVKDLAARVAELEKN